MRLTRLTPNVHLIVCCSLFAEQKVELTWPASRTVRLPVMYVAIQEAASKTSSQCEVHIVYFVNCTLQFKSRSKQANETSFQHVHCSLSIVHGSAWTCDVHCNSRSKQANKTSCAICTLSIKHGSAWSRPLATSGQPLS